MKIGIFDSGLGGLVIAKSIIQKLPKYDYIYLGDTKRVPYGNRPKNEIYKFTKLAVDFLFSKGCNLIILGCNTASALALRKIQHNDLKKWSGRNVLGVIVPTIEVARGKKIGIIATPATVKSKVYELELKKTLPKSQVFELATPELVPLIEKNKLRESEIVLKKYLNQLISKEINTLILGCTHYPILKKQVKQLIGKNLNIISQDEIIPKKLELYLKKHKEIEAKLSKNSKREFYVTAKNTNLEDVSKRLFGKSLRFKVVSY